MFSESDLDSLLSSFDWVAPLQSQAEQSQLEDTTVAAGTPKDAHPGTFDTGIVQDTAGTPHCSMDTAGIVHCLVDTAGTLHRSMDTAETHSMDIAGMTLHPSMDTAGTQHRLHVPFDAGAPQHKAVTVGNQNQGSMTAGISQCGTASAGTSHHTGLPPPEATSSAVHVLEGPAQVMDPTVTYTEKDLGKLAHGLACRAFFGDDVLVQSSLHGNKKRGLSQLHPVKMSSLLSTVHHHPSFMNLTKKEFTKLVNDKIIPSISHYCKELHVVYLHATQLDI